MDRDPVAAADAPTVVAVIVAHDADEWFADTLDALRGQSYPNLRALVVDAASTSDLRELVAARLPEAVVHRLDRNPGFGGAANHVLDQPELTAGARFLLFCHDDVVPAHDAVQAMVRVAQVTGAGIVGAKLVAWDQPDRLLQVGALVDRAGVALPVAERGELDQGQHDAPRDVFVAAGGFTLVAADLFAHVGGFDEGISLLADDLSLCWRARLAGARVVVAGRARVRHRESLADRVAPRRVPRLAERHRLRVVLTSYQRRTLLWVLPQLVLWSAASVVVSLARLRGRDTATIVAAWWWNLRRPRSTLAARRHVRQLRRVGDRALRRLHVRGMVHLLLRVQRAGLASGARRRAIRDRLDAWAAAWPAGGVVVLAVLAAVLLMGSRHLLTRGIPPVGDLAPFGRSGDLVDQWLSTWRSTGVGADAAAPTALGVLGGLVGLLGGHDGVVRLLAILGLVPLGLVGAARMLRPLGSRWAQVAAVVAYALVPLPYTALADGRWGPLAAHAAAPTLVGALARAGGATPFGPSEGHEPRPVLRAIMATGLVGGLLGLVVPAAPLVVVALAAGLAVGSLLVLDHRGAARLGVAGLAGGALAFALQFPWAVDLVDTWSAPRSWWSDGAGGASPADLVGFGGGRPLATAPFTWGLLAAAAVPLLVGRSWRAAWAVRAWVVAVGGWVLAWVTSGPTGDHAVLGPGVPLALAGAALALAVGLGLAAVEHDVVGRSRRCGPRRSAVWLGSLGLAAAAVPVLHGSLDGYWSMPRGSFGEVLGFLDRADADGETPRVLWLGDPRALPVPGRLVDGARPLAFAVTEGLPSVADRWPAPHGPGTDRIAQAAELAVAGETARLGQLLAPSAVDYVVVLQRRAPSPLTDRVWPAPAELVDALVGQLDLEQVGIDPAALVFRNLAARPVRSAYTEAAAVRPTTPAEVLWPDAPADPHGVLPVPGAVDAAGGGRPGAVPALRRADGYGHWSGRVPARRTVVHAVQSSDRWSLHVDGRAVDRHAAFGWANAFEVAQGGHAVLRHRTPQGYYLVLAAQAMVWVVTVAVTVRLRRRPPAAEPPPRRSSPPWRRVERDDGRPGGTTPPGRGRRVRLRVVGRAVGRDDAVRPAGAR